MTKNEGSKEDVKEQFPNNEDFVKVSFEEQKKIIFDAVEEPLVAGDAWYLIEIHWYREWKKYIKLSLTEGKEAENHHPGPINNKPLFEQDTKKLKKHLMDGSHYIVISKTGWGKLVEWYHLKEEQEPIERIVIESGLYTKETKVEVYLLELKLATFTDVNKSEVRGFSRITKLENVIKEMKSIFGIPEDEEVRLWNRIMSNTYELVSKTETTLQDFGYGSNQMLVLEQRNENNEWTRQTRSRSLSGSTSSPTPNHESQFSGSVFGRSYERQNSFSSRKGLCGLGNLGNTCFMNSALQCLSNTQPLTTYFLSKTYESHINRTNPLGMNGKIAEAYADLMEQMWSGHNSYVTPRNFKMNVGRFAPRFSGYQQQDSQELLAFLLDGLHEDLNLVKQKPYIELQDDKGRVDEVLAKEAWRNHSLRNSSVITENFHGLFKSAVECPDCGKRSITFDPFCYLSLPLPIKKERSLLVTFVPLEPSKKPMRMKVTVPKFSNTKALTQVVSSLTGVAQNKLVVADIFGSKVHKWYGEKESISQITDRDDIYVYETAVAVNDENKDIIVLPVYLREIKKTTSYSYSSNIPFGKPFLVSVPNVEINLSELYQILLRSMRRYVSIPTENDAMSTIAETNDQDMMSDDDEPSNPNNTDVVENENSEKEDTTEESQIHPTLVPTRLFEIKTVNHNASNDKSLSCDDEKLFKLENSNYLAVDWYPKLKKLYYDENLAEEYEEHPSTEGTSAKKTIQLEDCLELFLQKEKLGEDDPWYCPQCKEHRQAYKKFDLWSLPKVLVIHLKRFSYNKYWRDKLDALVNFPVTGLDLSKYVINKRYNKAVYDLHAVSNHYGGLGGGHYTAYAVNCNDGQWHYFDDSSVSSADALSPVSKAAYVLFYTRRQDPEVSMLDTSDLLTEDDMVE